MYTNARTRTNFQTKVEVTGPEASRFTTSLPQVKWQHFTTFKMSMGEVSDPTLWSKMIQATKDLDVTVVIDNIDHRYEEWTKLTVQNGLVTRTKKCDYYGVYYSEEGYKQISKAR